jgi:PAS domain S-box-containing protein
MPEHSPFASSEAPQARTQPIALSPEHPLLKALDRIAALPLTVDGSETLLQQLVAAGAEGLGWPKMSLQLVDPERRVLHLRAAVGLPQALVENVHDFPLEGPQVGICATAIRHAKPVIVEDVASDPRFSHLAEWLTGYGIRSVWSIPLLGLDNRCFGTLAVFHTVPAQPSGENLSAVQVLAREIALALETARLLSTTRRQAEELAASQTSLEAALDQADEGYWIIGPDRRSLAYNQALSRIFGGPPPELSCAPEQILTRALFFHPDGRPFLFRECPVVRAFDGHVCQGEEVVVRRSDGSQVFVSVKAKPLQRDGKMLGVLAVVRDRTEEKRAEHQRNTLRRLSEQLVAVDSPRDVAEAAYRAAIELFKPDCFLLDWYDAPTHVMHSVLLIDLDGNGVPREYLREPLPVSEDLREVIQGRPLVINRIQGTERMTLRPIGSGRRSASLLFAPVRRRGETVGLLSVQSYTVLRYSEADLPLLQELADLIGPALLHAHLREELEARRSQEARQERLLALEKMAAGVAHNFNNLLTGILGYADLLCYRDDLDPSAREMVEHIRTSALDAAAVVKRLQEFYRSKSSVVESQMLDLCELIRGMVEAARPRWYDMPRRTGVTVDVQLDLQPVPRIRGYRQEILNGLNELLFNAVEAMPKGGVIRIATRQEGQDAVVTIADTGVGIPPEVLEHCFEPFFLSKVRRGSGLGLPSVHGMVARHGGQISVRSEVGKGTEFTLRFPPEAASRTQVPSPPVPVSAAKKACRVLAIDDEPIVGRIIQATLSRHGYSVILANDGPSGLGMLKQQPFDIVITDLGMPAMDGFEVARKIKELLPALPVVILTGWEQNTLPLEGVPVDAVLQKPIGVHDLISTIEGLVS